MTAEAAIRRPARGVVAAVAIAVALQFTAAVGSTVYLTTTRPAAPASPSRTQARPAPRLGAGDVQIISPLELGIRAAAVRTVLARRSAALLAGNRAGFLAGVDPGSPAFRVRQAQLFDNLRAVPLGEWSYTVDPNRELPQSPSRLGRFHAPLWVPWVTVQYRIAGYDPRATVQRQYFTFVRRSGHWFIGADDDFEDAGGQTARGLWDFGPIVAARSGTTLVLGHPRSRNSLHDILRICDAAIPRVTRVWGRDWPGKLVVLVPDTQRELGRIIQEGNDLSQIAAVATADLAGTGDGPAGERVIVNPPNFAKLGSLGRRVVLQHEITHVATRALTTGSTPTWLSEGFADYVGYLGTGVPVHNAARELAVDVRAGRIPSTLPSATDFAGVNPHLAQVYEMSWLACRLISGAVGQAGLVRFYRAVGSYDGAAADAVDATLKAQLHMNSASFTIRWRAFLAEQLK